MVAHVDAYNGSCPYQETLVKHVYARRRYSIKGNIALTKSINHCQKGQILNEEMDECVRLLFDLGYRDEELNINCWFIV